MIRAENREEKLENGLGVVVRGVSFAWWGG